MDRKSTKRKTREEYIKNINDKQLPVILIGDYKNSRTKTTHQCKLCGFKWECRPGNILKGYLCPVCGRKKASKSKLSMTSQEYAQRVAEKKPFIIPLEEFRGIHKKIKHFCKKCGNIWFATPENVLKHDNDKCGLCYGKARKPNEQYIKDLNEINPYIKPIEEYKGNRIKIKHLCLQCGYEWSATPHNILSGHGCPKCKFSNGEKIIENYLIEIGVEYVCQKKFEDCKNKKRLPFDFYIPSKVLCIEYDGEQHSNPIKFFGGYEGLQKRKELDDIKTEYCKNNNINLLRINYDEDIISKLDEYFK